MARRNSNAAANGMPKLAARRERSARLARDEISAVLPWFSNIDWHGSEASVLVLLGYEAKPGRVTVSSADEALELCRAATVAGHYHDLRVIGFADSPARAIGTGR